MPGSVSVATVSAGTPTRVAVALAVFGAGLVFFGFAIILYGGSPFGEPPSIHCPPCTWPSAVSFVLPLGFFFCGASLLAFGLTTIRKPSKTEQAAQSNSAAPGAGNPTSSQIAIFFVSAGVGIAFLGTQIAVMYGCASGPCMPPPEVAIPWGVFGVGLVLFILGSLVGLGRRVRTDPRAVFRS